MYGNVFKPAIYSKIYIFFFQKMKPFNYKNSIT